MRISTRGKYALEALVFLGYEQKADSPVSLGYISEKTQISEGYLEQLFRFIKKSGIVVSQKGKCGGYLLAKPADKITIYDILISAEGPLSLVRCADSEYCKRQDKCLTHKVWESAYGKITKTLNSITLDDLICDYQLKLKKAKIS